jgi:hypothetical protein
MGGYVGHKADSNLTLGCLAERPTRLGQSRRKPTARLEALERVNYLLNILQYLLEPVCSRENIYVCIESRYLYPFG